MLLGWKKYNTESEQTASSHFYTKHRLAPTQSGCLGTQHHPRLLKSLQLWKYRERASSPGHGDQHLQEATSLGFMERHSLKTPKVTHINQ